MIFTKMIELINAPKGLIGKVNLTASKSISNRVLIAKYVGGLEIEITNLSEAKDTVLLENILSEFQLKDTIFCENAGTTIRFLTSFLCIQKGNWKLTGSQRMLKRPINDLVNSLNELGAKISYDGSVGFPPLVIQGNKLKKNNIAISGATSSQYISSLLLIAPYLEKGLNIEIIEPLLSKPYVLMTLKVMKEMGVESSWIGNMISVKNQPYKSVSYTVENDWSGASFWYSFVALSEKGSIEIPYLNSDSSQGDSILSELYTAFGVETTFNNKGIHIQRNLQKITKGFKYDLSHYPDLALPIAITCVGLGIDCQLTGLESLKYKECDRLHCLKNELEKFNINSKVNDNSIEINGNQELKSSSSIIETHKDHRIAMSIAPLIMKIHNITFDDKNVVNKSYPKFWEDMEKLNFDLKQRDY
jgi:3-phosphoshikimate 1-carboxyvinyltransferase